MNTGISLSKREHVGRSKEGQTKIQRYGWSGLDKPGVAIDLPKKELRIDPSYQRTISEHKVLSLASDWSWLALGALLVAERSDGQFFVFDGQHRLEAAHRRADVRELPCVVFKLDDIPAEAMAFYQANCNRSNVTMFDKLRALLVANDKVALDAVGLMESQGYTPARAKSSGKNVVCIGTFLAHFKKDRGLLTRVWPVIAEFHNGIPISERMFAALMYLAKYGEPSIDSPDGRKRLFEIGYPETLMAINKAAAFFTKGSARIYADGIVALMNKGRRTHKFILRDPTRDSERS